MTAPTMAVRWTRDGAGDVVIRSWALAMAWANWYSATGAGGGRIN